MGYHNASTNAINEPLRHLPPWVSYDYHSGMSIDIFQIRLNNLLPFLEKRGETARLAKLIKVEPNYISRIKAGKKRIGEDVARRLEDALGQEYGWMDRSHDSEHAPAPEQVVITAQSEEELVKLLREKGEAYAFELLRKAFMEQENKKGD